jgi:hypothetical protein
MTKRLLFLFLSFFGGYICYGQSGCSGCSVTLPESLAADTIFLSEAPNGQAGTFYQEDISFRLPQSTDAVVAIDPTAPRGLPISKVTITGVSNLPPGLSWEANQMEFNITNETDGCLRFCGLPLQPGLYFVEISITVRVIVVNENASVRIPILIEPAERVTDGFKMANNFGCGNAEVSFQNNVPSNGKDGYRYFWNLGNGNTSTEENPGNQNYDLPGTYAVQYQALVDTTGYFLTQINVHTVGCNDLFGGRPDLKVNVLDPDNNLILITDLINNAQTPVSYQLNLKLDAGTYVLEVIDADNGLGGADDFCGSVSINQNTTGTLSDGNLTVTVDILHPVDTITSSDTVFVFEQPDPPLITQTLQDPICEGDTVLLTTNFRENIQWYQNSADNLVGTDDSLLITQKGQYWAAYTSPDGCISTSVDTVSVFEQPDPPLITQTLQDPICEGDTVLLTTDFSENIQWYQNSADMLVGTDDSLLVTREGQYWATYTSPDGCISTSADTVSVFEQPAPPLIAQTFQVPICEGDTVLLTTDFSENIQWYQNSTDMLVGTDDSLLVTQEGQYWATYTSPDGCVSTSASEAISFEVIPQSIAFVNENNILSLSDSSMLPDQSSIRWFKDGVLLEGAVDITYCIEADGIYTLAVTDMRNGCRATYSQAVIYDPNFPLCDFPVVEGLPNGVTSVQLFPNPTYGPLNFLLKASEMKRVQVSLHTITGQQLKMEYWDLTPGTQREEWDLLDLPAGMYVIRLSADEKEESWRVVKL